MALGPFCSREKTHCYHKCARLYGVSRAERTSGWTDSRWVLAHLMSDAETCASDASGIMWGMISWWSMPNFFLKSTLAFSLRTNSREPLRSPWNTAPKLVYTIYTLLEHTYMKKQKKKVKSHFSYIVHGILEVQLMEDAEDVVTLLPRRRFHQKSRHPLLLKVIPSSERWRVRSLVRLQVITIWPI